MSEQVIVSIHPESTESCRGCDLLKGVNVAQCLVGFAPRFEQEKAIRPPECCMAVETVELVQLYLGTWGHHEIQNH